MYEAIMTQAVYKLLCGKLQLYPWLGGLEAIRAV